MEASTKQETVKAESPLEFWIKRQHPNIPLEAARALFRLADEGAPIPYIALYEKDAVKGLKTRELRELLEARHEFVEIQKKQAYLLREIEAQAKLTPALKHQIERSTDLDRLEDFYAPFKLKKQSLGNQAKQEGLGKLADYLWAKAHDEECEELAGDTLEQKAAAFVKEGGKYDTPENVLKGVQDILTERIAENAELRNLVRESVLRRSKIISAKGAKAKQNSRYAKFFSYQEPIGSLKKSSAAHRYLLMRKGWMEDELVLSFDRPDEGVLTEAFENAACLNKESIGTEILLQAARLALKGSVYTIMENEAHRVLKEEAEKHVIDSLMENLQKKVLQAPFGQKSVMGIDPGSANHPCSLVLVDATGKLLLNFQFKIEEATDEKKQEFLSSLENLKIEAVAIAHGPKSKEVREAFRKIIDEAGKKMPLVAIHEHSSSIYASSPAGKEEFPELDVNSRRAVFVARFLQDPLLSMIRLDPKFLSLGELQHEVNQGRLRQKTQETLDYCVNFCGVDLNTAPALLLSRVAGLNPELAAAVVKYRDEHGAFPAREALKKVPGMGDKEYRFASGFLKVKNPEHPLDQSFLPPELALELESKARELSISLEAPVNEERANVLVAALPSLNDHQKDFARFELQHFGEDPRGLYESFEYTEGLKSIADLQKNVPYAGVVTNVTSFGVFVDIGIDQDGLVHISELTESLAKNPFDTLFPGDRVTVFVSSVNAEKKQISLTMRQAREKQERRPKRGPRPPRGKSTEGAAPGAESPAGGEEKKPRERRGPRPERVRREEGGTQAAGARSQRPERKPKEPKKPQRDPKTGAIVKLESEYDRKGGPRVPTRAAPTTFNPFANLAQILNKDKEKR